MKIRILTAVWGSHLDLFENACLRSLLWPKNKETLKTAVWDLFTRSEDMERLQTIIARSEIKANVTLFPEGNKPSELMGQMTAIEIERCLADRAALLMAPADIVFADGSVETMVRLAPLEGLCVAVAHPRVTPEILHHLKTPASNAELVTLAFRHLHPCWVNAEMGREQNNSLITGVCWERLAPGSYAVHHRLPATYLARFVSSDLEFFRTQQADFTAWDHIWPSKLVEEQRQRYIGSSDAAFVVEVTDVEEHHPPLSPASVFEPDKFWRNLPHNRLNRGFVTIFREG